MLAAQQGDQPGEEQNDLPPGLVVPPASVRTPAEELATFTVQDGCRVELVASEPLIGDPVAATFDPAGRLWVVEMKSFMRDVDGHGELAADGRIVVLTDRDGDGAMDCATVFLDKLVLPRAVLPLQGGALVIAPPDLLWAEDRDGDLVAERTLSVAGGFEAGLRNPEHAGNGLLWGLDNGIHLANDARVFRWTPKGFSVEPGNGGGQWGISQDDRGRLFFDYNEDWLRADLVPGRYAARAPALGLRGCNHRLVLDESVWPIRKTPGVNRGYRPGMLKDGVLTRHTAVCAPCVYRGDLLDCRGDVFVCEPAGNLVRRFRLADQDGLMRGENVHPHAEFLASTDERFRPVNLCSGPDGALYVVDMYRGVIQHRNFVTTFLRKQILARGLERPTGLGRIWRVLPEASARPPARLLHGSSTAELVQALGERDGWRRDMAQRLLVQRQDPQAVPALRALLRSSALPPSRSHALAVLHGLSALDHSDLRAVLNSDDPGVLGFALGYAPPFLSAGDAVLWAHAERLAAHAAPAVRWHLVLALGDVQGRYGERALSLCAQAAAAAPDDPVLIDCLANATAGREGVLVRALCAREDLVGNAAGILRVLAQQVGKSRDGARQEDLLQAAAACMQSWQQRALLQGCLDALPRDEAQRQGFYLFAATPPALAAMARTGDPGVRTLVSRLLGFIALRAEAVAAPAGDGDADLPAADRARIAAGSRVYGAVCAACHQPHGRGMAGLAPPLRDSEWVTGSPARLIRIALHGVRGPLTAAGTAFDSEMPGQGYLGDDDLAAALSWLRRAFGHRASPIAPADIAAVREQHKGRSETWPAAELRDK